LEKQTDRVEMPEGHLSTKLNLQDEDNPESSALITISTNNEEIFAQFSADNFKAEMVSLADLEKSANENVENVDGTDEDSDESLLNSEEHFLSLKIVEEYTNEGEFVQYTFGDELLKVLKKYKAQTHIAYELDTNSSKKGKNDVNKNAFNAYGDGGVIPTKVRVYYDYDCGGKTYYKTTDNGFYNSYTFKSCKYPYERSTRKRYKYFTVTQDVLTRYTPVTTSACLTCSKGSCRKVSLHSGITSNGSLGGISDQFKSDLLVLSYFRLNDGDTWYAGGTNESAQKIWCDVTAYFGVDPVSEKGLKGKVVNNHYQSGKKSNQLSLFAGAKARGGHHIFATNPWAGEEYQQSQLSEWKGEQFAKDSFITVCPQGVIPSNVEKYQQSGNNKQAAGRDLRYCD